MTLTPTDLLSFVALIIYVTSAAGKTVEQIRAIS